MIQILSSAFALVLIILNSQISFGVEIDSEIETARAMLFSSKAKDRVAAAQVLAGKSYDELKDIKFTEACQSDAVEKVDCRYLNHMAYHLIGIYKKHAKSETNPSSPHYCYKGPSRDVDNCPYLSKLRWFAFNHFGSPFSEDETDRKVNQRTLQKMALDAIEAATSLNPKTPDDLQKLPMKQAENNQLKWFYVEMSLNQGIYALSVIHHFVWSKREAKFIHRSQHIPFEKTKDREIKYASDPLNVRWVRDTALVPDSDFGILRVDGECCGNDSSIFHIFAIGEKINPKGSIQIDSLEFKSAQGTWERVKPVFDALKLLDNFKTGRPKSTTGKIEVHGKKVAYTYDNGKERPKK